MTMDRDGKLAPDKTFADWVSGFHRWPRCLKGYGFTWYDLDIMDVHGPLTPEKALQIDDFLKRHDLIPKDAYLDCFGHIIQQDIVVLRWLHRSFPEISKYDVIDIEAFQSEKLEALRK